MQQRVASYTVVDREQKQKSQQLMDGLVRKKQALSHLPHTVTEEGVPILEGQGLPPGMALTAGSGGELASPVLQCSHRSPSLVCRPLGWLQPCCGRGLGWLSGRRRGRCELRCQRGWRSLSHRRRRQVVRCCFNFSRLVPCICRDQGGDSAQRVPHQQQPLLPAIAAGQAQGPVRCPARHSIRPASVSFCCVRYRELAFRFNDSSNAHIEIFSASYCVSAF